MSRTLLHLRRPTGPDEDHPEDDAEEELHKSQLWVFGFVAVTDLVARDAHTTRVEMLKEAALMLRTLVLGTCQGQLMRYR